jgi:hypothetical protein
MRKGLTILVSSAVVLSLGLSAAAAQATAKTTWTVDPGGAFSVSGDFQTTDTSTSAVTKCTKVSLSGTLKSGSGLPGSGIGKITKAAFSGCTLGSDKITAKAEGLPWLVDAKGYDKAYGNNRSRLVILIWLGWRRIRIWITFSSCDAVVQGSTAKNGYTYLSYSNKTGAITLGPTDSLQAADVKGCTGLLNNGDPQQISGADTLTPLQTFTKS